MARRSVRVVEYDAVHDFVLAHQDIETAVGIVEEGTIALNHYEHIGRTRAGTGIVQEQLWYLDDLAETCLDLPLITGCVGEQAWSVRT